MTIKRSPLLLSSPIQVLFVIWSDATRRPNPVTQIMTPCESSKSVVTIHSGRCTRNCVQWKSVRMNRYEKNMHTGMDHLKNSFQDHASSVDYNSRL